MIPNALYQNLNDGLKAPIQKSEQALPINQVVCGDAIQVMRGWPAESVNLVMFSPPYWGLRDYGVEGQIGLEPTYQEYITHMVEIGREIKRILSKDGSWYLNLGDTYSCSPAGNKVNYRWQHGHKPEKDLDRWRIRYDKTTLGIPAKCQMIIPHRVALALVDDGWILRNTIVWYKPNSMPSSVKDRLTNKYEFIFHLVKSKKYYYDLDAIREPHKVAKERWSDNKPHRHAKNEQGVKSGALIGSASRLQFNTKSATAWNLLGKNPGDVIDTKEIIAPYRVGSDKEWMQAPKWEREGGSAGYHELGQNPGDFWSITTKPFKGAHFAVYPEALCERPIKSSCPKNGIVLDPMCGAGTTCVVAKKLGRRFIGIDLNPDYCEMARKRLAHVEWPLDTISEEKE